jgi:hypothetical protein
MSTAGEMTAEDFETLMSQIAPKGKGKAPAMTLEEALKKQTKELDESIAPREVGEVLPIPHEGMTLAELASLMRKYKKVIEEEHTSRSGQILKQHPTNQRIQRPRLDDT